MSTTTTVPDDVRTRHVSVVIDPYLGQLARGGGVRVPYGNVLATDMLGQTNVHAGQGPRHPNAALIEHPTAMPGDILPEAEINAAIAAAKAKQALVPEQQKARAAQQAKALAASTLSPAEIATIRTILASKPAT